MGSWSRCAGHSENKKTQKFKKTTKNRFLLISRSVVVVVVVVGAFVGALVTARVLALVLTGALVGVLVGSGWL